MGVPNGSILRNKGCKLWMASAGAGRGPLRSAVVRLGCGEVPREAGAEALGDASAMPWSPAPTTMPRAASPARWTASPMSRTANSASPACCPGRGHRLHHGAQRLSCGCLASTMQGAPQSAVTDFSSRRDQDNTIVKVNGQDELYVIPDAVIFGG